ncbi:MAG: type II secretion system F family protein [Patescibacteria group bacterium]|nr:type II secretion system F family protein [Patescibacteria group bacterium]
MKFNYQARTKEGEVRIGIIEAASKESAMTLLQKYDFFVTYLKEADVPFYAKRIEAFGKVSSRDIVLFSRQLSMMFGSEVPLAESLRVLSGQTRNLKLRERIFTLSKEIEGGSPFSKALARYPETFSNFYVAMVKAGEVSGNLSESLTYLADHLEREYELGSKTKGALIYPSMVLLLVFAILFLMVYSIIPQLKTVIEQSAAEIPKVTQSVLATSEFVRKNGLVILSVIFLSFFAIIRYYKTKKGKSFFDRFSLQIPVLGPLIKTLYLTRFAESLATLISGGLLITRSLELSADIVGNEVYKQAIFNVRDEVRKGTPISSVLALSPEIFPPVFVQMTLVGEKTGSLDNSLMSIAKFYQKEVERGITNALAFLEPALIMVLGLVVGGMMLAVLMPLYQVITF